MRRNDWPSIFLGICLGTHNKRGHRIVPSYRVRRRLSEIYGLKCDLKTWREWVWEDENA